MAHRTELDDYILQYSKSGKCGKLIELLNKNNIDKDTINDLPKDANGATVLHLTCRWGNLNLVTDLCRRGAYVNAVNNENATPLHLAALKGHSDIVQFMCEQPGIDTNIMMTGHNAGATALMYAAWKCYPIAVSSLLEKGADKTIKSVDESNGYTALHYAAKNIYNSRSARDIMELLIAKGVDVDVKSKSSRIEKSKRR